MTLAFRFMHGTRAPRTNINDWQRLNSSEFFPIYPNFTTNCQIIHYILSHEKRDKPIFVRSLKCRPTLLIFAKNVVDLLN